MSTPVAAAADSEPGIIWILPFFGQGHLLPCVELCKQIASRNYNTTLIIPSHISTSIVIPSSSLHRYPLLQITEIPSSPGSGSDPPTAHHLAMYNQMLQGLETLLSARGPESRPVCAVIDVMMGWTADVFKKFEVPMIAFFTSGACSAAMECAVWQARVQDIKPGEIRLLPGLPEDMALTESDLKRRPHGPPGGRRSPSEGQPPPGPPDPRKKGPPGPSDQPPWMKETERAIAFMFNTCNDLERPFIDYLACQIRKPVWGVGPLLPEEVYKSSGPLRHDRETGANRLPSSVTEDQAFRWLDLKPRGSVLYVSFGSEVSPTVEEHSQLAEALEGSDQPFIWVIQAGVGRPGPPRQTIRSLAGCFMPGDLESKVGERGLIIYGWAPQLLILSHRSTGGFLSHCGWNSTVEAIGCGVPILAWPIRGDQHYNAKLVINHLKVGHLISDDLSKPIRKDEIVSGVERLMGDAEMKKRAHVLRGVFDRGFPASSVASLDALKGLTEPGRKG